MSSSSFVTSSSDTDISISEQGKEPGRSGSNNWLLFWGVPCALIVCALIFGWNYTPSYQSTESADTMVLINANDGASLIAPSKEPAYNLKNRMTATEDAVANWLGDRYSVPRTSISPMVLEAFRIGKKLNLSPSLILAVAAVESSFDPRAENASGAKGLMQVMTNVHKDKYRPFGGIKTAFDPLVSLEVGSKILSDYIRQTGSVRQGLKYYVGAANVDTDYGYADKVLAIRQKIQKVVHKSALIA